MAPMRGDDRQPRAMFSYVSAGERVPHDHPLRAIRAFVDEILREMTREFDALYAQHGRPSISPERLLRAGTEHWSDDISRKVVPPGRCLACGSAR
jgi:transposase